jgi:hypothetical protein
MARACRAAGLSAEAQRHHDRAAAIAQGLSDPEERDLLELDLRNGR